MKTLYAYHLPSKQICLMAYDPNNSNLYIEFKSEAYRYEGIDQATADTIANKSDLDVNGNKSHGATFYNRVKKDIPSNRVCLLGTSLATAATDFVFEVHDIQDRRILGWVPPPTAGLFQEAYRQWLQAA